MPFSTRPARPRGDIEPVTFEQRVLLTLAALGAGTVDAIGGGGGLITVPALLAAGLPPHVALATNKGQSTFGSFAAIIRFSHAGLIDRRGARMTIPVAFAGSLAGTALVLVLRPETLRPVVLALLLGGVAFFAFWRPAPEGAPRRAPRSGLPAAAIAALIGAYDGFFGPGTGTFAIAAYVGVLGLSMTRASAEAKVLNFASNFAAMALFAARGVVLWSVAIPMAAAQLFGGFLGAHLAVRRGARLIRAVVLPVVLALIVKIGRDLYLEHHP
jgi:uncharacterized protein